MKTEAYFIPHCDDNSYCDLGAFQYTCPYCNMTHSDYEVWWEEHNIICDKSHKFKCESCKKELTVKWVSKQHEYIVY